MRKIFKSIGIMIFLSSITQRVNAQQPGVAINTSGNAPHSSALLDVQSTNKGILIPSMTTVQRTSIASPAEGLLVYDVTASRTYQYQGGIWRMLITNDYWSQSVSRKWVYNGSDSIGIGTVSPNERLHVSGNIKSSGNINAGGVVEASGITSSGSLTVTGTSFLTGTVTGNTSASFGGNVNSNTSMSINDPAGIFDFTNNGVDKGFIQLSGDNLRLGTYSSNTQGSLVVRTNGADQVKINDEGLLLQNNGKVMRSATGSASLTPLCYAAVEADGAVTAGTGNITVTRYNTGIFFITCPGLNSNAVVMVTPKRSFMTAVSFVMTHDGVPTIAVELMSIGDSSPSLTSAPFNIVIFQQ